MTNKTTSAIDLVERVAKALYERHRAFSWPGHPADDGARVYLHMPLPIEACEKLAEAAINAFDTEQSDTITRLQAALIEAIDQLESCAEMLERRGVEPLATRRVARTGREALRSSVGGE